MNSPPFLPSKLKDQTGRVVSDRICLLVLGMHRSGTSAVTRVLSIAGAKLPASLMGPGRGNEVGHWESDALATYNDQLLAQLGSRWGDWRALEVARLPLNRRRDIQAEIADLLAAEFADAALFVVKDPRICRFAPLFIDAIDGAGIEPRIVLMVRNPLEVAESLERRDNMNRGDAALQWLRHVLDSEASTRSRRRVIVTYASLLMDWRTTLERITETLNVTWPYAIDDVAGQVGQFLDRDRRHHAHSVEDVLLDPTLRGWIGEAYSALLVLESNPESKAAMTALDAIRREFNHAGPILHALLADAQSASERQRAAVIAEREQEASHLRAALGETEARVAQLSAALDERDQRISGLGAALEAKSADVQELANAAAQREREATDLNAALRGAETEAQRLAATLAEREREAAGLQAALRASETEARERTASVAEREREAAELKAALRNAETRALRVVAALEDRNKRIAGLDGALRERKGEAEQLAARLAEREAEGESLRATLGAAEKALSATEKEVAEIQSLAEKRARRLESEKQALLQQADLGYQKLIEHFRSSTSWKVTRPLRALKDLLPNASFRPRRPNLRPRKAKVRSAAGSVIAESGLFDEQYYLSFIRDETVGDAISHYLECGSKRGIDPNPLFDSDYYTTRYAAHLDEITNPFVHFIQSGARQGFDPSPLFQTSYYRQSSFDVQTSDINPLLHYLKFGRTEGRMPIDADPAGFNALALRMHRLDLASPDSDRFDVSLYAALYPEVVAAAGGDDGALASHYEMRGRAEGRVASLGGFLRALNMPPEAVPINFDESEYYELNADLGSAFPHTFFHAIRHYLESGIRERRRYSYSQCYIDAPWQGAAKIVAVPGAGAAAGALKVACLVHVGRSELWAGLLRHAAALDGVAWDTFVSVSDAVWTEELHARIRVDLPGANIVVSETEARDGGGYLDSLAGVQLDDYAAFLLIPSTAAPAASEDGAQAKSGRLNGRHAETAPIADLLARMTADPSIGIIATGRGQEMNRAPILVSPKVLKRALELAGRQSHEAGGDRPETFCDQLLADVCTSVGASVHWN